MATNNWKGMSATIGTLWAIGARQPFPRPVNAGNEVFTGNLAAARAVDVDSRDGQGGSTVSTGGGWRTAAP